MSDSLSGYLTDHLAGANFAVELLELLRDHYEGEPLSAAAAGLLAEIEEDREVLKTIAGGTPVLKEAVAWLGQKLSEFRLGRGRFGAFEALEVLALGIQGKLALWNALSTIADRDERLRGVDLERLAERARSQHARVEELRLQAAPGALLPAPE